MSRSRLIEVEQGKELGICPGGSRDSVEPCDTHALRSSWTDLVYGGIINYRRVIYAAARDIFCERKGRSAD